MIIDHIGLQVIDYERSKAFYRLALTPLGIGLVMEIGSELTGDHPACGFGRDGKPEFWIAGTAERAVSPTHVAFVAANRSEVDAFHAAAMAAGGVDNGGPGLRPIYHTNYYGAFALDPDGNNIEAVCHRPA